MLMKGKWFGVLGLAAAVAAPAQNWRQVGPPGGTVISMEADPKDSKKLYLGTSDGHVFSSTDEGQHWQLLSRIGVGQDDVITHILVDSRNSNHLYASTWTLYSGGGGVYRSEDAGRNWHLVGLQKETVRALAQSPTNPKIFVAGSLTGVYRSQDDGSSWERISPANHDDLRNFDSVAFDPKDENIIYAGTYHLPWKTTDEGVDQWKRLTPVEWVVNAIVIDPKTPNRVIIGTERQGVQISEDAGATFSAANTGFHHQHILDVAMDQNRPERALVVLTFDTNAFLATKDGGTTWNTLGPGLKRTDLRHVYAAPSGWLASLSAGGLMRYDDATNKWLKSGLYIADAAATPASQPTTKSKKGAPVAKRPAPKGKSATQPLAFQVNDLLFTDNAWFAATAGGVLIS